MELKKELETKDLILKPYEARYVADAYNNIFCNEETAKYVLWKTASNIIETQEKLEKWDKSFKLLLLIIEKKTSECIGYVATDEIEPDIYDHLGIAIGTKFTQKGYASQVLLALIDYLKSLNAKELRYSHFKENVASQKLAQKIGFEYIKEQKNIRNWDKKEFDECVYTLAL